MNDGWPSVLYMIQRTWTTNGTAGNKLSIQEESFNNNCRIIIGIEFRRKPPIPFSINKTENIKDVIERI